MLACIPSDLWAPGTVGQRKFIEPLFTEDANIKDELDLPRSEFFMLPDGSSRSFSASFEKALYPNRWSVVIEQSRVYRRIARSTIAGFDDLEVATKLALYRRAEHELVLTPAVFLTAPTGSHVVAENRTKLQPALVFAKGFGDLKWGWLRPLALQGDIGYEAAVTGVRERHATYDMVLEYSVPNLNRFIRNADTGLTWSTICGWVTPHEQFSGICTHSSNSTVRPRLGGTSGSSATFLRPGLAYIGKFFQISTAADVPLRGYLPRRRVGAVVLFDLFLNKVVPAFGWTPFGKHHHDVDEPEMTARRRDENIVAESDKCCVYRSSSASVRETRYNDAARSTRAAAFGGQELQGDHYGRPGNSTWLRSQAVE
jgi:hypothetical protein